MKTSNLFNKTSISYSFDRYSEKGWRECIEHLIELGFNEEQIEAFMLSKHMRWAGDCSGGEYGTLGLETLQGYFKQYPEYSKPEYTQKNLV